ncbi:hypothetical protein MUY27_10265 [Mucilaginibacter sp. RS28]|uniref:Lipoprotein n=1 Tax=Mucilaginibacter straminoryzae TaxID=2932774 RepID=A0A9X2BDA4_9SPHI|nr:hypothetical protein [Mucilaginibacter straminoryzae]MCJ8210093.1 hypothetical protein [Mucilaginibacter straminoryzae]
MRKLIYLLPFAIMALGSCMKSSSDSTPVPVPTGTFAGKFKVLKRNVTSGAYDTTKKINITIDMSTATGYKVTGDTTTLHAGSYGDFALNGTYILFSDATVPKTGVAPGSKIHLNGYYPYAYNGTQLQFYTTFADTMAYVYELKKN